MTSKFAVSGTETTITFSWTAPTALVISIVGACAEYLFNHGYGDKGTEENPITFEILTNSQKLALVEAHMRQVVLDTANTFKHNRAVKITHEAEEATKYEL